MYVKCKMLFAHSIPGHPRPMGRPHLTWMDTAMHDMGSLGRTLQIDLPRDWANLALQGGGQPVLSFEQCLILFSSFPLLLAFVVGGLGFEFCVFVPGWRHALRRPLIIIIMNVALCFQLGWVRVACLHDSRFSAINRRQLPPWGTSTDDTKVVTPSASS